MKPKINWFFRNFPSRPVKPRSGLLPIPEIRDLLNANALSIDSIWQSAGIASRPFDHLYRKPIGRTAEQVLCCPATEQNHHAWPGGLLSHLLQSSAYALRFRKGVNLPVDGTPEERKTKADLYTYAVFAAALLRDLGPTLSRQTITLYNRKQERLNHWSPFLGDLASEPKARYLQVEFLSPPLRPEGFASSLLYASRILPGEGLHWLASDPEVYAEFLHVFLGIPGPVQDLVARGGRESVTKRGAARSTGSDQRIHWDAPRPMPVTDPVKSEAMVAQSASRETPTIKPHQLVKAVSPTTERIAPSASEDSLGVPPIRVEESHPKNPDHRSDASLGEAFRTWLESALNGGRLEVNEHQSPVHVLEEDLFLVTPVIFQRYAAEHAADWKTVRHEFGALGIHRKPPDNPEGPDADSWKARVSNQPGSLAIVRGWIVSRGNLDIRTKLVRNAEIALL